MGESQHWHSGQAMGDQTVLRKSYLLILLEVIQNYGEWVSLIRDYNIFSAGRRKKPERSQNEACAEETSSSQGAAA